MINLVRTYTAHAKKQERPPLTKILLGGNGAGKTTFTRSVLDEEINLGEAVIANFDQLREQVSGVAITIQQLSNEQFAHVVDTQRKVLHDVFQNDYDIVFETIDFDEHFMRAHGLRARRRLEVDVLLCDRDVARNRYIGRERKLGLTPNLAYFEATHDRAAKAIRDYLPHVQQMRIFDTSYGAPVLKLTYTDSGLCDIDANGLQRFGVSENLFRRGLSRQP